MACFRYMFDYLPIYDGRTEQIEKVKCGDLIQVVREKENPLNANNFMLLTRKGQNVTD